MSQAPNPMTVILDHPLVHHALADLRDRHTPTSRFRHRARELAKYLILEATRDLETDPVDVETVLGIAKGRTLGNRPIVVAPILRAGLAMVESAMELLPEAEVRHIGLYRNESSLTPVEYYVKLPDTYPPETTVLIIDPMLATGGSLAAAIEFLFERGAEEVTAICILGTPEGIAAVRDGVGDRDVTLVLGALDDGLDEHAYIVPGLGDAGDRLYGTVD